MKKVSNPQPSALALRLFRWYCRPERQEELHGDLEELFFLQIEKGAPGWKANLLLWWNVIRCYRSYSQNKNQYAMTSFTLLRSYLKLAIRHSWKNKWSVAINIVGLGIALSTCIFAYTIYAYNNEFDSYFPDTQDVYRLHSFTAGKTQKVRNEVSPGVLDYVLQNEVTGVEQTASFIKREGTVRVQNEYFDEYVGIVTPAFFELFKMPLRYGTLLGMEEKQGIYLTKEAAERYFGDDIAIEERLTLFINSTTKIELEVLGVFENMPPNISFDASSFISEATYLQAIDLKKDDWKSRYSVSQFIKAQPN
ncbi:MAG: ABC transporter permease, partial [Bacteroidota bacterium]